jgi:hypothetical protein
LIDIVATINVMTRDTMLNINMKELLRHTPIVLQLEDKSTFILEGVIEDLIVSIDS